MGAKQIETRSWKTQHRGPLLIHASAGFKKEHKDLCMQKPFSYYIRHWTDLPLGCIIGKVNLEFTAPTEDFVNFSKYEHKKEIKWIDRIYWPAELEFGDYSHGRYGWLLSDIEKFEKPIAAKGSLGLWDYKGERLQK